MVLRKCFLINGERFNDHQRLLPRDSDPARAEISTTTLADLFASLSIIYVVCCASSHNGSGRDFGVVAAMHYLDSIAGAVGAYPRAGPTH
jgi:hypothetical protein